MKFTAPTTKEALIKVYRKYGDRVRIVSTSRTEADGGNMEYQITAKPIFKLELTWKTALALASVIIVVISAIFIINAIQHSGIEALNSHNTDYLMNPSIAVMPFVNLSGDDENELFGDGLADELISSLARLKKIKVVNRTSAFTFKRSNLDLQTIGKKLNVGTVLEGSFRINDNNLRIVTNLVNVSDGFTIWTETYNSDKKDLFKIQEDIGFAIVDALKVELGLKESDSLRIRSTENIDAFSEYNKAWSFMSERSEVGFQKAITHFENAILLDKNFARAYLGLGYTYILLGSNGIWSAERAYALSLKKVEIAIQLDPTLGESYAIRAIIKRDLDLDWEGANEDYLKALELNPNSSLAHHRYGLYLGDLGSLDEAMKHLLLALEFQPLSRQIYLDIAFAQTDFRNDTEAIKQLYETVKMFPDFKNAHRFLMFMLVKNGKIDETIAEFARYHTVTGQGHNLESMRFLLNEKGLESTIKLYIDTYGNDLVPYEVAAVYMLLGDKDKALENLELAFNSRSGGVFHSRSAEVFEPLHDEPRFIALLEKMGLNSKVNPIPSDNDSPSE